jgi:hypothetical protein
MKHMITTLLILLGLTFLVACNMAEAAENGGDMAALTDVNSLQEALNTAGVTVETAEMDEGPTLFEANEQALTINGERIAVYQFTSEQEASEAASTVTGAGTIIGNATIDWAATPHFYQSGNLIVIYAGEQEQVLTALETALGEPFLVGSAAFVPEE